MKQENILKILTISVIIILILVIWMLLRLNSLEKEITQTVLSAVPSLSQQESLQTEQTPATEQKITASIAFTALSSPNLQPQTQITVTIENVLRLPTDGTVIFNVKALTNQASAYSVLNMNELFAFINLDKGISQPPSEIKGSFNSLPPRTATVGQIIFKNLPDAGKMIFRIGPPDNPKFYEFDFIKNKYSETQIG